MKEREVVVELAAAAEAVARAVKMPMEGIDGGFVKLPTPLATRLINAVVDFRQTADKTASAKGD